jgi:hypothetical protein
MPSRSSSPSHRVGHVEAARRPPSRSASGVRRSGGVCCAITTGGMPLGAAAPSTTRSAWGPPVDAPIATSWPGHELHALAHRGPQRRPGGVEARDRARRLLDPPHQLGRERRGLGRVGRLGQHVGGAGLQRAQLHRRIEPPRQHDHRPRRVLGDRAQQRQAVDVGHLEVERDDVGRQRQDQIAPGAPVGRLAHHRHAAALEDAPDGPPRDHRVVDDQHPDWRHHHDATSMPTAMRPWSPVTCTA